MRKILFYNWVQFDNPFSRGGGVNIYQLNLLRELMKRQEYALYMLSSGMRYTLFDRKPEFIKTSNIFESNVMTYEVINSPIFSPGHDSFGQVKKYLTDTKLCETIRDFIELVGPFDVIHFNNYEGLSLGVMKLKKYYPYTKFVISLHNYYLFCPQVNFWKNDREDCSSFNDGLDCTSCLEIRTERRIRLEKVILRILSKIGILQRNNNIRYIYKIHAGINSLFNWRVRSKVINDDTKRSRHKGSLSTFYKAYRKRNVEYLNKYFDTVLAVSNSVRLTAIEYGIKPEKIRLDYIGTNIKGEVSCRRKHVSNRALHVAYIGYARKDKGFYFLLDALEKLNDRISLQVELTIAVRLQDKEVISRILALRNRFFYVHWYNGYKHDDLRNILGQVEVGIVPVLWRDNLPQVSIEYLLHGVKVLASDLGGAKELAPSKEYIFKAGDESSFLACLENLVRNRHLLSHNTRYRPLSMSEHVSNLEKIYFAS